MLVHMYCMQYLHLYARARTHTHTHIHTHMHTHHTGGTGSHNNVRSRKVDFQSNVPGSARESGLRGWGGRGAQEVHGDELPETPTSRMSQYNAVSSPFAQVRRACVVCVCVCLYDCVCACVYNAVFSLFAQVKGACVVCLCVCLYDCVCACVYNAVSSPFAEVKGA